MALTREQILAIDDRKITRIHVDDWNDDVYIRVVSAKQREDWERASTEPADRYKAKTLLVSLAVCDESGKGLFTREDVDVLHEKSILAIDQIYNEIIKLNVVGPQDIEAAKKN